MLNRILPRFHRFHCPDEHLLAAYVDQQLIGAERERVESHLARCDSCLQQVRFLVQHTFVPEESAPLSLVRRAKILRTAADKNARFGLKWVSVATACTVIAIGLLGLRGSRPKTEEHSTIIATAAKPSALPIRDKGSPEIDTAVRSASPTDSQPLVMYPQAGTIVRDSDLTIRWKTIPNVVLYEVRIVSADGDLVWRKKVLENSVNAPKQTLQAGKKYFVWVRALLANGKAQQSPAVGFFGG